jgi:glycosyltransferase involved in cell wall biosynthesis
MRLVSIINAWSDTIELLPYCIENHLKFCDGVIVIWSITSNHGEKNAAIFDFIVTHPYQNVLFYQVEPVHNLKPLTNETRKRNQGIQVAKNEGYTHFILADADEFYEPELMNEEKARFDNPALNGLVHKLKVYIAKPTLWCNDHTLACGIHKLNKDTYAGNFAEYPFAYDSAGRAHIDPSRMLNFLNGIEESKAYMHHMSYVRKNIEMKINNSTANLKRSKAVILEELRDAKPGYVSRLYHQELKECPNYFVI